MKKLLKWIAYLVIAIAVIFVGGSFFLPGEATVSRSIEIAAPADKIFPIVGDLKRHNDFSPWTKIDPKATYAYSGADKGVGQKVSWQSDHPQVGTGSQEITQWDEGKSIKTALDFGEMGTANAGFTLDPSGQGTKVTWDFHTKFNSMTEKWFGLMFDRWVGGAYDEGLANLKRISEAN